MKGIDFEEERVQKEIIKYAAKRVLLQLPEGLKPEGPRLAKMIEKTGALPIISADPCYGACDIAVNEAESLGADLIVHFGHSKLVKHTRVPTIYIEARADLTTDKAIEQALPLLANCSKIGLATSVQHLQALNRAREILTAAGKTVIIGDSEQMAFAGQVIGCNYSNVTSITDEVDAFLFVGGGMFHALGIALSTSKPTIIADPYDNRAFSINTETQKILKQRWVCIEEAQKAEAFGVLVGLKPGQKHFNEALKVKKLTEKHGKAAYLFAGREISPDMLLEFPSIDAYVNTACPGFLLRRHKSFQSP